MPAPQEVSELVERFDGNRESYRSSEYNETETRREFIDPFFKALDWDIDNKQGYAEAYKDVVHEDAIKIGRATKAPDYAFRIGGVRKFFVEAKRPGVDIKNDPEPAYQLRRYAWSAKLPLSCMSTRSTQTAIPSTQPETRTSQLGIPMISALRCQPQEDANEIAI